MELSLIDRIRVTNRPGVSLEQPVKSHPVRPFFAIKRSILDTLLLNHAKKCNACVWEQTRVTDIHWQDKWSIRVKRLHPESEETILADFLIGADGRNSFVAHRLAADTGKKPNRRSHRVGVQMAHELSGRSGFTP